MAVTGTLNANGKAAGSATSQDAHAGFLIPILEAGARTGKSTDDLRAGSGIDDDGDPMFTMQAGKQHAVAYGGNNTAGPIDIATAVRAKGGTGHGDFESETFIAHTLKGEGFDASEDGTGRGVPLVPTARAFAQNQRNEVREMDIAGALASEPGMKQQTYVRQSPAVAFQYKASASNSFNPTDVAPSLDVGKCDGMSTFARGAVRRLTPKECCRLQGFPDDYLDITYRGKPAADGPRYKALGNSMAVPVMRWIGERIELVEVIQ